MFVYTSQPSLPAQWKQKNKFLKTSDMLFSDASPELRTLFKFRLKHAWTVSIYIGKRDGQGMYSLYCTDEYDTQMNDVTTVEQT